MKLAANLSLMYPEDDLVERMDHALRDGFIGVEILFPYSMPPAQLAEELASRTLALALINTPIGPNGEKGLAGLPGREQDFRQGFAQSLAVCQATGCGGIHVMAGFPPADADRAACLDTLTANLKWAAERAASANVVLTLEALNRGDMPGYLYWRPDQVTPILQELDLPNVRLQFDLYHCQKEGLDLVEALRAAWPYIHHVQFAGAQGRHEPDLQAPGVAETLRLLISGGYQGWLGCEYVPAGDPSEGLAWRHDYYALVEEAE